MLRAIIIDDEPAGIEMIRMQVAHSSNHLRVVASTQKEQEGILLIEDFRPEVVFLGIHMPGMSGPELLSRLTYHDFKLVFTITHRDHVTETIRNKAFDYLLKPIDTNDFKRCIDSLISEGASVSALPAKKEKQLYLELRVKDGIQYIKYENIIRLEASRSYTVLYLEGGIRHVASRSLKEFEARLDTGLFFRCHHSHIINLQKVQKFVSNQGYFVLMEDGSMADIAKKSKDPFLERLKNL